MVLTTTTKKAIGIISEMAASTTDIRWYISIELSEKNRQSVANNTTDARRNCTKAACGTPRWSAASNSVGASVTGGWYGFVSIARAVQGEFVGFDDELQLSQT